MAHQSYYLTLAPWQKLKNLWSYIRVLFEGDRFEWDIDLRTARKPVLLIHGFAMPRQCMAVMEDWLRDQGYEVFAFRLGPANFLGVDKAARIIGMKLRHLSRAYGMRKIAIVGHSLGGIVGRAFISLRRGDRIAHTLITLASPHQGHPAGRLWRRSPVHWFTQVPHDLAPDSDVMKLLRLNPIPPHVYAVSMFSDGDRICPAPICTLDIPEGSNHLTNIFIKDMNHVDFLLDPEVCKLVRQHLEEGFRRADALLPDPDETMSIALDEASLSQLK